jgi:hypothetical protein
MPHPIGGTVTQSEVVDNGYCIGALNCPDAFGIEYANASTTAPSAFTLPAVTAITLPDQSQYSFQYDPTYGSISKIEFPTGGYVRFVYGIRPDAGAYGEFLHISTIVVTDVYTSTGSGSENHWIYSFPSISPTAGLTSSVTAPDGSYTTYTGYPMVFSAVPTFAFGAAPSWKEASRLEYSSSGALMKSVATMYSGQGLPVQVATTLYDGPSPLQQLVQYNYDTYSNEIEKDESDFYGCSGTPCPGPTYAVLMPAPQAGWLRSTFTNYLWSSPASGQPGYNYTQAHIVDKPSRVLVASGNGTPASLTTYIYDQPGNIGGGPTGLSTHDDAMYGSNTVPRGDLTSENQCITISGSGTSATCASSWNTSYYYDLTGQRKHGEAISTGFS